jgi:hypothetical protein
MTSIRRGPWLASFLVLSLIATLISLGLYIATSNAMTSMYPTWAVIVLASVTVLRPLFYFGNLVLEPLWRRCILCAFGNFPSNRRLPWGAPGAGGNTGRSDPCDTHQAKMEAHDLDDFLRPAFGEQRCLTRFERSRGAASVGQVEFRIAAARDRQQRVEAV